MVQQSLMRWAGRRKTRARLLADDVGVGAGNGDFFEAIVIEIQDDFEVLAADAKALEIFAVFGFRIHGGDGDGAGSHFLRNKDRKVLGAFLGPVVKRGENRVLVIEIVVEDDNVGSFEKELLGKRAGAVDLEMNGRRTAIEVHGGGGFFGASHCGPLVMNGRAGGGELELRGDVSLRAVGGFNNGAAAGEPAATGGGDFEFLRTDLFAGDEIAEFAFLCGKRKG